MENKIEELTVPKRPDREKLEMRRTVVALLSMLAAISLLYLIDNLNI